MLYIHYFLSEDVKTNNLNYLTPYNTSSERYYKVLEVSLWHNSSVNYEPQNNAIKETLNAILDMLVHNSFPIAIYATEPSNVKTT